MKRIAGLFLLTLLCVSAAFAGMDDQDFAMGNIVGAATNTKTYALHGTLEGVYVDITASATCTVTVASDETTLFTLAGIVADALYNPRATMHTTAGAAATVNAYNFSYATTTTTNSVITWGGTNSLVATTNSVITYAVTPTAAAAAQSVYGKQVMSGDVTVTVVGQNAATFTNAPTVTILFER